MASRGRKQPLTVEEPQPAQPLWREAPTVSPRPQRELPAPSRPAGSLAPNSSPGADRLRRPIAWRQFAVLLLSVVAAGGLTLAWTSDLFRVSQAQTQIQGNQRVAAEAIYAAADIDGLPVFQVHPAAVTARVDRLTGIESSAVRVRLPAQVTIVVTERTPFVAWQVITRTIWLDRQGEAVPIAGPRPALTLVDEDGATMQEDGRLASRILANLQEIHEARPDLTEIHYGTLEGLFFRAPENWTVYLGRDGSIRQKLRLLDAARPQILARTPAPTTIDLRFGDVALIR